MEQSFIAFLEDSIKKNWDLDALTDYKGATLQYKDVARKIEKLHIIFELSGIKQGDKIAVCGRNSSHWGVTFLAAVTYGAVIVPILHEFKSDNIHNIVNHSEARLLMVGDMVWENLNDNCGASTRISWSCGTTMPAPGHSGRSLPKLSRNAARPWSCLRRCMSSRTALR